MATTTQNVPASPTIREVLAAFLEDQRERLRPRTFSKYDAIADLLAACLDGYGHDYLSRDEAAVFNERYRAKGDEHREFCDLFGPDKIMSSLPGFVGWFMIRKVLGGADLKRYAGTVTRKLSAWLAEKGYITEGAAAAGGALGAEAARNLPKAERAARLLDEAGQRLAIDPDRLASRDYIEFDHFRIVKLEGARVWLESLISGRRLEAVRIPREAAALLQEDWDISCAFARVRGEWRMIDVANVYPH